MVSICGQATDHLITRRWRFVVPPQFPASGSSGLTELLNRPC